MHKQQVQLQKWTAKSRGQIEAIIQTLMIFKDSNTLHLQIYKIMTLLEPSLHQKSKAFIKEQYLDIFSLADLLSLLLLYDFYYNFT